MRDRTHIFLSYPSQESDFAVKLAVDLKNMGVGLWIDRLDIAPGEDWHKSLQDAIDNSVAVLAVVSKASINSEYCRRELARANRLGYPVVPLLLTPLSKLDWPLEIEGQQYIDFTQWRDDIQYHQQLSRLATYLKATFKSQIDQVPDPETRYLTSLVATLQARNSLNPWADPDVRPKPFVTFEWNLKPEGLAVQRTGTFFDKTDTIRNRQHSLINKILENFDKTPQLALLGAPGTGKTSLLEYLCLKMAYARQMTPDSERLPVLVRLADWPDDLTLAEFLAQAAPFALPADQIVYLLDGLDEISRGRAAKVDQLCAWMVERPAFVLTCRTRPYQTEFDLPTLPTVTANDLNLRQVQVFLCSLFSEQRAEQLLDHEPAKYLQAIYCNPRVLNRLANINYRVRLENVGEALRELAEDLINYEQHKQLAGTVSPPALEQALAELAFEPDSNVPIDRALYIAGDQAAIATGERTGFLTSTQTVVRFRYPVFRSYYAAVWMFRNDLDWRQAAHRSDFDRVAVCLAGLVADPDALVDSLYQEHPRLALYCLVPGVAQETAEAVITHWLETQTTIRPPDLPALPTLPDRNLGIDALIGLMQTGRWPIRQAAHHLLQTMPVPHLPGIVELLNLGEHERDTATIAVKQISTRALPTLIQHIQHANPTLRSNAIWALAELADKACVPALVQALNDDDPASVSYAIQTLGYLHDPDSYMAVVDMLGHPDETVRQTTLETLHWAREDALPALAQAIDHPNQIVREQAITLIAESRQPLATEILIKATYDTGPDLQLIALAALENRETPATTERLIECLAIKRLRDTALAVLRTFTSPRARAVVRGAHDTRGKPSATIVKERLRNAIAANPTVVTSPDSTAPDAPPTEPAATGPPATTTPPDHRYDELDALLDSLVNAEWGEREEVAKALCEYAKSLRGETVPYVLDRLRSLLTHDDWSLRWAAVEPLTWIGDPSVVPDFIARLEDANWTVRVAAIRGLQELHDPAAIDPLLHQLEDPQNVVREATIEALGSFGDQRVVPAVAKVLDDPDEMLRLAAAQSLGWLHQEAAIRPLTKALSDSDKHVRWAAVYGLRDIADTTTVSALIPRLQDTEKPQWENERICDIAAQTLERIGTARAIDAVTLWKQNQMNDYDIGT